MPFLDKLQLEHVEGDDWKLITKFRYWWPRGELLITVPAGYVTDQASVPKLVLPIIVKDTGNISMAAVPHDYGYDALQYQGWTKSDVDMMFKDAMIEAGVPKWRAWIAWTGVRLNFPTALKWDRK